MNAAHLCLMTHSGHQEQYLPHRRPLLKNSEQLPFGKAAILQPQAEFQVFSFIFFSDNCHHLTSQEPGALDWAQLPKCPPHSRKLSPGQLGTRHPEVSVQCDLERWSWYLPIKGDGSIPVWGRFGSKSRRVGSLALCSRLPILCC